MVGTDRQLRPAAVASRKLRPHNLPERVLVIDEDPLAREKVLRMLRQQDSAFTATAGWEGLHGVLPLVRLHCPAVLILNLPDSPLRAAALLDELRTTCEVKILCVTTYSPMMLEQLPLSPPFPHTGEGRAVEGPVFPLSPTLSATLYRREAR